MHKLFIYLAVEAISSIHADSDNKFWFKIYFLTVLFSLTLSFGALAVW